MSIHLLVIAMLVLALPAAAATPAKKIPKAAVAPAANDPLTGLAFVRLPKGCFRMGSPDGLRPKDDPHWRHLGLTGSIDEDERPVHEACVDAFAIGQTEVTATAWRQVMGGAPPHGRGSEPAAGVTWVQVHEFLDKLNGKAGRPVYRLPTEAEWEYACRAGSAGEKPPAMDRLIEAAWYSGSQRRIERAGAVAGLPPNAWGLHDMLGNVWEWTAEVYRTDAYRHHVLYNPRTAETAGDRTLRGASYRSEYLQVRCASRSRYPPDAALEQIGFRLVKTE